MQIRPYLNFAQTQEALNLYRKMGATDIEMTLGSDEMFSDMPDEQKMAPDFVMNASFELFGHRIYASDTWGNTEVDHSASNIAFDFDINLPEEVDQVRKFIERTVELGGEATMPLGEAEWTPMFGMVRDAIGVSWIFNGVEGS